MSKIKILFLAANPTGTGRLQLDEEVRSITEKIRSAEYRDSLELVTGFAARADDFLQLLNIHKPHILHFSGHGSISGEILLVDSNGQAKAIAPIALKSLFTTLKDNIEIVILSACYSRTQAEIVTEVIDYTIGMSSAIGDQAAIIFSASFYRAIGFGRSVLEAFEQGKVALLLEGISEDNVPELLVKAGANPSYTFFEMALADTPQAYLRALANEIVFNLGRLDEFLSSRYYVLADQVYSANRETASLNYFSCMTSVFESPETQKALSWVESDLRKNVFQIYMGFTDINDKANALIQVFRSWRAAHYIDSVERFQKNLRPIAEGVIIKLRI